MSSIAWRSAISLSVLRILSSTSSIPLQGAATSKPRAVAQGALAGGPSGRTWHRCNRFLVVDGGMEANARPLIYGSRHPIHIVSRKGDLLSSEGNLNGLRRDDDLRVVVGRCCESGDSQTLDEHGRIAPRLMAEPGVGDLLVIGGCGAYCSSMAPFNYNSHVQSPEVLLRPDGEFVLIRRTQTLAQMVENEIGLEGDT